MPNIILIENQNIKIFKRNKMAQAEFHEVMSVEREKLLSTITDYQDYPNFVEGCTSVEVKGQPSGKADVTRVTYRVNVMSQDVTYTLDHKHDLSSGRVEWTLVASNFLKKNDGRWEVK